MQKTAEEIQALFKLIDDPDEEVYSTISNRILHYGSPIIPDLEHLWESTLDEVSLERIEMMIYQLRLQDLKEALIAWKSKSGNDKDCLSKQSFCDFTFQK